MTSMNKYECLLFDADNTLLDFDANEKVSLENTFRHFSLPFDDRIMSMYHRINIMYWNLMARGGITREELLTKRFETLFEEAGITADPVSTENYYRSQLDKGCQLVPGAMEICKRLKDEYRLFIITNGVASTQHNRLRGSGLEKLMDGIFISEEIGYNKPALQFFRAVENGIPGFDHKRALVIGDGLESDIRGGILYGLDTCWINIYNAENNTEIVPTYEIQDIKDLPSVL